MARRRIDRRLGTLAAVMALAATLSAGPAAALDLRGGLLRQDAVSLWAVSPDYERSWAVNAELGFDPWLRVLGGDIAPMLGGTWAPGSKVDMAYVGLTWTVGTGDWFLRLGLGGAVHNGKVDDPATFRTRRQLGSRLLFHVPVEVGARVGERGSVGLYFSHVSNGQFADPNPGMDSLGVRLGWRF